MVAVGSLISTAQPILPIKATGQNPTGNDSPASPSFSAFPSTGWLGVLSAPRGAASKGPWTSFSLYFSSLGSVMTEEPPSRHFIWVPDDHEVLSKIGLVATKWARLEHQLDLVMYWLMDGADGIAVQCIASQLMGVGPRYRAIIAMAKRTGIAAAIIKKIEAAMNKTFEVSERRNRIVHDVWYIEESSGDLYIDKSISPKTSNYGLQKVEDSEFQTTLSLISQRQKDANVIYEEIAAEMTARHAQRT
jgi:hypothetical protein